MHDKDHLKRREAAVSLDMLVEELAQQHPAAVGFLTRHNIRCIRCGEPLWCTVGELFQEEGVVNQQHLLDELNEFLREKR